jgi:hypothetical protein
LKSFASVPKHYSPLLEGCPKGGVFERYQHNPNKNKPDSSEKFVRLSLPKAKLETDSGTTVSEEQYTLLFE